MNRHERRKQNSQTKSRRKLIAEFGAQALKSPKEFEVWFNNLSEDKREVIKRVAEERKRVISQESQDESADQLAKETKEQYGEKWIEKLVGKEASDQVKGSLGTTDVDVSFHGGYPMFTKKPKVSNVIQRDGYKVIMK